MATVTYVVVAGDTLWSISEKYLGSGYKWRTIAEANGISVSKPIIYAGQKITINTSAEVTETVNNSSKVTIEYFGLQAGTDTSVFATWKWDKSDTENYQVKWYYDTGNDVWFVGSDSTTEEKQNIYSAPNNAKRVKLIVKPISKKKTVNKKEVDCWTASWSTAKIYSFSDNPPSVPEVPSVEIKDYTLTATLDNLDVNGDKIQFQIVKDNKSVFATGTATIITGHASYSRKITAGSEYKVRCRAVRGSLYSEWTAYSGNVTTQPAASSGITVCKASSETSVYLEWAASTSAETYELEYTTKKEYFDGSDQTTTVSGIESTHYEKTGLETGQEYFFRVRAVNEQGESAWSKPKSVVIGTTPSAPTTWSSTTTAITGDPLTLYWMHNVEDGSAQTYAQIEMTIGTNTFTRTVNTVDEEDDEKTMHYVVDTSGYTEGTKIQWRVRTAGITKKYGEWSIQRTIDIYAPPTLAIAVVDSDSEVLETVTSFPFYISGETGPNTQTPIGYHVSIVAKESYETVDSIGNFKMVSAGDEVYSKNYDTSEQLLLEISANSVDLENNVDYRVVCTVSMNSGLTVESSAEFTVSWADEEYSPNAEIGYDAETFTTFIRPYCDDVNGDPIADLTLSVYRREFDGSFTELVTGIINGSNTYITDPHPSLDYARYRVVATSTATGAVSYYDVPGYPIGESAVIIQWDENWTSFDTTNEDEMEQPMWSGSLLRLPYNIDVSDSHENDVSLVKYIGRKHPVTYYGTQLGEKSDWSVEIERTDVETLYALRRLAVWMGDVYVREPSGSGYWANISVSFSQKHCEVTIPVNLSITRVSGGV
jgi:LysM repeat protein